MLMPHKLKHRKQPRGKMPGLSSQASEISFGRYGLKALERAWVTARQIEAARRAITRYVKRGGKIWVRIFPDKPVSAQPLETGLGGGKGSLDHFVAVVRPGRVVFEMDGVSRDIAREALRLGSYKLPIRTRFMEK